jgi:hypothetical protein
MKWFMDTMKRNAEAAKYGGVSWLVTSGMDPQEAVKLCQEVQDKVCGREDKEGKNK